MDGETLAGESHTIFKLVFLLGVLFLLVGLLIPGADAAWNDFTDTLQNFPEFNNPFGPRSFTFAASENGTEFPLNIRGDAPEPDNCDYDESPNTGGSLWWGCVNTQDDRRSYVTTGSLGPDGFNTSVFLEGFPDVSREYVVISITITYQCAGDGTTVPIFGFRHNGGGPILYSVSLGSDNPPTACPDDYDETGGGFGRSVWGNVTVTQDTSTAGIVMADFFQDGAELFWEPSGGDDTTLFLFSYVSVSIGYQVTSTCEFAFSGNPWDDVSRATVYVGCVIAAFFGFVVDVITLAVNTGIFFGEVVFWFFTLLASFIAVFAFFFALPGAPPIVQDVLTVLFIALIGFLAFVVISKARGSEST